MDPPGSFPLIIRGGTPLATSYDGGILTVRFRKSPVAAGNPTTYGHMPRGSGAWVDRPINDAEPSIVKQQLDENTAFEAQAVLRNGERFWKFISHNTNTGHFEASSSEPDFMQGKID